MSGLRETSERRLAQPITWRPFPYEKDTRAVGAASPVVRELSAVSVPYESEECTRSKLWLKEER